MWLDRILGDHIGTLSGFAFSSGHFNDLGEGLPLIRIRDIESTVTDVHYSGPFQPTFLVFEGDILVGMDGEFNLRKWRGDKALLNQRVLKVFAKPTGEIDLDFIYHWLAPFLKKVEAITAATTVKHLSSKDIERAIVCSPPKKEQKKIAFILNTLVTQIEATEALIAKQEQVRTGLMQDLFTRGVDEHGQLRPARKEAPHLYSQTELGWLPRGWEAARLSNLTSRIVDGVHHTPTYVPHGVPFVTVKSLTAGRGIDTRHGNFITMSDHRVFQMRADPRVGDVLVSKDGTLGVARYVDESVEEFSIFVSVAMLRPIVSLLNPAFLCEFFRTRFYEAQMGYLSAGSGLKHIHLEHFRKFVLPRPELWEQTKILEILSAADQSMEELEDMLRKLQLQKSGLMQDLLTGKVSVAPLLEGVAA